MRYIEISDCTMFVFDFIHAFLSENEPAPSYNSEQDGLNELDKVLKLVKDDRYYPNAFDKSAYLICSIAGSQYFSNGNKRLAIAVLMYFLIRNSVQIKSFTNEECERIIGSKFPDFPWESNDQIPGAHALLLYNLAIVIGFRDVWGTNDFSILKEKVSSIFFDIYKFEE